MPVVLGQTLPPMSSHRLLLRFCTPLLLWFLTASGFPAEPAAPGRATREMQFHKRYLNLPVKNRAPKKRVSLVVDDRTVREFEIELAEGQPDFWVFLDLKPFQGKQGTLYVQPLSQDSPALQAIVQADGIRESENLYQEPLRPQFHFSSRRGWNNDPNGLVFYKGEYHLFYQHNPYGWDWGNMHWGHAISPDLVHWTEMPIALYPYKFGDWAFSGCALVDWKNTSGFKSGKEDLLVIAYTSTGRGECIAFSNDRGRTWVEYSGNPVVKHEGRDPKIIWHEPTRKWVMAVYDEFNKGRYIAFYTSTDLKAWNFESRIEGFFECPDIFELPVIGARGQKKWVLTAASSEYRIGDFDGRTFKPETPMLPGHRGNAFYAAQTYSDVPDGRRIQIGWGRMSTPGMPFNQMMCFPTALALRPTDAGPRLAFEPVKELKNLHQRTWRWGPRQLDGRMAWSVVNAGELLHLECVLSPLGAQELVLSVRGVPLTYNVARQELSCLDRKAPVTLKDGKLALNLLADRTSLEIFADNGLVYMPMAWKPDPASRSVAFEPRGGRARMDAITIHELKSIWPRPGTNRD